MTPNVAKTVNPGSDMLRRTEAYLSKYVSFTSPDLALAGALWAAATHLWPHFDAFPYLVITSETKRSGKTRFAELLSFLSANSLMAAGISAAGIYSAIAEDPPTLFVDEAESQSSEAADTMRQIVNCGYRRGQFAVRKAPGGGIEKHPVYCPKAFILIGDVNDTLRDRSVIIRMVRSHVPARFLYGVAEAEGNALRDELHEFLTDRLPTVVDLYATQERLEFLPDRDEEIWMTLFAVCGVLAPERLTDLKRVAVDVATEKTQVKRRVSDDELKDAEEQANLMEYKEKLIQDLAAVIGKHRNIFTADALKALHELPTAPWRKYKGKGLDANMMADMLSSLGVAPKYVRSAGGRANSKHGRGYSREDVLAACKRNGITTA